MTNISLPRSKPRNKKKSNARNSASFFESIKGIGSSVASSVKSDLLAGTAKTVQEQLIGASQGQAPEETKNDFDFANWIEAKEKEAEERGREQEKQEQKRQPKQEKVIFSFIDEKLKKEINEVREELKALIAAIGEVESQIEKAVVEEVVNPGTYHLNFFDKLKSWLQITRKNLQDTSLWLEMWSSRSNRSHYWKMANKKGTKYSLSQERQVATQTG